MHWYVFVENQSYGPYSDNQMRGFVAEGRISNSSLISNTPQAGFFSATEFDAFNLWFGEAQQSMLMSVATAGAGAVQATATSYAPIQPVQKQQQAQQQAQSYQIQQYEQPQPTSTQLEPIQPVPMQFEPVQLEQGMTAQTAPTAQTQASQEQIAQAPSAQAPNTQGAQSCVFLIMAEIRSGGEMAFLQALQSFGHAERVGDTVWLVRTSNTVEQIRNTLSQTLNQQDRLFIMNGKAGKTAWFNIGTDLDHRIRELWDEDEG